MFDNKKLITLVQQYECLWNPNNKGYYDRIATGARRQAWQNIASAFSEDWNSCSTHTKDSIIDDLQNKWKNIRCSFVRERNKKTAKSKAGSGGRKAPAYFEMMEFLPNFPKLHKLNDPLEDGGETENSDSSARSPWNLNRRTSAVWKHFDRVNGYTSLATCNICYQVKKYRTTFDLKNHLIRMHKNVAEAEFGEEPDASKDVIYVEEFGDDETTHGSYINELEESDYISDDPLGSKEVELNASPNPEKNERIIGMGLITEAVMRLDNVTANVKRKHSGLDDFEAFGRYIVTSLRRMVVDSASKAQREMQQIVDEALKGNIADEDVDIEQQVGFEAIGKRLNEIETPATTNSPNPMRIDIEDTIIKNDPEEVTHSITPTRKPNEITSIEERAIKHNDGETSLTEQTGETAVSDGAPAAKKKKLTSSANIINHVMCQVNNMMNKVKCESDPDDYELLGRYITESLRNMPVCVALRVENDLYNIVIKHKLESMRKHLKTSHHL